jgi:hypothetical protein
MRFRGVSLFAAAWICACGGQSTTDLFSAGGAAGNDHDGGSATAGSSSTSSSAGGAGSAGSTGAGGAAGTTGGGGTTGAGGSTSAGGGAGAGTAGSAGASGSGGAGGAGGTGGIGGAAGGSPQPECTTAADCKLQNDCCTCQALAPGEFYPSCPPIACLVDKCEALQLPKDAVACVAGRCVAGFECDSSKVTCKLLPPVCEPGFVPGVKDTCYTGTCVPVTECVSVKSCAECGKFACAAYATRTGPQAHCVTVPPACGDSATCACFGPTVCTKPFSGCGDLSGLRGVTCTCPTCF